MSVLNLLWIVPLSAGLGFLTASLFKGGGSGE